MGPGQSLTASPAAAAVERWRLRGVPSATALEAWRDILAATHLRFDVHATQRTPSSFDGAVSRRRIGDLTLLDCASSPWRGQRGEAVIREDPEPIIGFQCVRRGVELVRERGRQLALTPGDVVVWDGWQPTDVEVVEPFLKRTLLFPRDRVLAVSPRLAEQEPLPPLNPSRGLARLLVRYIDAMAVELPALDGAAGAAATDAALELLRGAIEPGMPTSRAARREALRAEIRRYVRAHLQDPGLCPDSIARAHAISVRALHALFEDTDESVSRLVRRERLARCLEDLERPSSGSVTEIAFRWGFRDAAHFSRVFKRELEITPSEAREAALARIGKESGAAALEGDGATA